MYLTPRKWFLLVVLIIVMPIWSHLSMLPIQLWDESRLAINAFELYKSHHWIVTTYNGAADFWNSKPPFLIWIQVIFFKLFGVSELSLRLPSAIVGTLTCFLIYWWFARHKKYLIGFLSVFIMVTSWGYIKYHHSPRTGDYDAMLTFFVTTYCIAYYTFLEENRKKYFWIAVAAAIGACMTKSVAGLVPLPALFLYTLYKRKLVSVLKMPDLYIGVVLFLAVVIGFYALRESYTPGDYIKAVMYYDLGRFSNNLRPDASVAAPLFYYDLLINKSFNYWYIWLFSGITLGWLANNKDIRDMHIFVLLISVNVYLVINNAVNKCDWYDMPMYPFISVIAAIGIYSICKVLVKTDTSVISVKKNVLAITFLFVIGFQPYVKALGDSMYPDPGDWIAPNTAICKYLKSIFHGEFKPEGEINIIKDDEYAGNLEWYQKVLKDKNIIVNTIWFDRVDPTKRYVVYQQKVRDQLERTYNYQILEQSYNRNVTIYQLNGKK